MLTTLDLRKQARQTHFWDLAKRSRSLTKRLRCSTIDLCLVSSLICLKSVTGAAVGETAARETAVAAEIITGETAANVIAAGATVIAHVMAKVTDVAIHVSVAMAGLTAREVGEMIEIVAVTVKKIAAMSCQI